MATHLDFGHDFFKLRIAYLRQLHDMLGLSYQHDDDRTDLVIRLEKYGADFREAQNSNCKKYLSPGFYPENYTMAMMRSVLSQYGVHYGTNPRRPKLVDIFMDQLPYLKRMNGLGQPDAQTESLTDDFCSMNVNGAPGQSQQNTFPMKSARKTSRKKNVNFDISARVQPPRQAKQAFQAPENAHRGPTYGMHDPQANAAFASNDPYDPRSAAAHASASRAAALSNAATTREAAVNATPQRAGHPTVTGNYQANYPRADPTAAGSYDPRSTANAASAAVAAQSMVGTHAVFVRTGLPGDCHGGTSQAAGQGLPTAGFEHKITPPDLHQPLLYPNLASCLQSAQAVFTVRHSPQDYGYHPQVSTNAYRAPVVEEHREDSDDNDDDDDDDDDIDVVANHFMDLARRGNKADFKRILTEFKHSK